MIISFAWTTAAFKAGRKSVTRRQWTDEHARKFKPGTIHQAYDKSPRIGGKQIGTIRILSITKEPISDMPDSDYEAEGFQYMQEKGLKFENLHPYAAFQLWKMGHTEYWVIRFKILDKDEKNS